LPLAIIFLLPKADEMSLVCQACIMSALELFAGVPQLYWFTAHSSAQNLWIIGWALKVLSENICTQFS